MHHVLMMCLEYENVSYSRLHFNGREKLVLAIEKALVSRKKVNLTPGSFVPTIWHFGGEKIKYLT